jgi:3-oxo-5-alpha-steroid 4-dehydrogenase 1
MSEVVVHGWLLRGWLTLAFVMFVVLLRFPAPYGRHSSAGWGRTLPARTGWLLMEAPASLLFLLWFVTGTYSSSSVAVVFMLLWQAHYLERAFHYPLTLAESARPIPALVVACGVVFNSVNTYLNGRYLFTLSGGYEGGWLRDPRFVAGVLVFAAGYGINRWADHALRRERTRTGLRYCRMDSGLFRYVCCPNYLGEMLIWTGWAMATWSLSGLSFAVWTAANLLPRARAHRAWCVKHLDGYPAERRAALPGIW